MRIIYATKPVMQAIKRRPIKMKMLPSVEIIPNLTGFVQISRNASFAAEQKFLPVIAI